MTAPNRDLVLSDKELQRMEAVCEAATPGPWQSTCMGSEGYHVHEEAASEGIRRKRVAICTYEKWETDTANSEFIAAARTALPQLLAEVRRLRSVEHRQQQQIAAVQAACEGFSSVRVSVIQQAIDGEK